MIVEIFHLMNGKFLLAGEGLAERYLFENPIKQ